MDTELLSKMLGTLLLDADRVDLPGFGRFEAEVMPASFSDRGCTINPPYRRLQFVRDSGCDGKALAAMYAEGNSVSEDEASEIVGAFCASLDSRLDAEQRLEFPGLGTLKTTRSGGCIFVCDPDLDIYPDGFGLQPVSIKARGPRKQNPPAAEEEPSVPEVKVPDTPKPRPLLAALVILACLAAVLFAAFLVAAKIAPDFVDRMLYTTEELQLLK